jgi:hypothetical protein
MDMSTGTMRRQCAWFGCSAVAIATYTFDSSARTVWIDTPLDGAARAGELCHRHARSLTPPRGWSIEDRRPPATPASPQPVADGDGDRARFESEAELRTLLDAHSPLLARAFRSSGTL